MFGVIVLRLISKEDNANENYKFNETETKIS